MDGQCGCDSPEAREAPLFGCFDCGTTCCAACAIHLESATYCRACAGSLLGAPTVQATTPFELH